MMLLQTESTQRVNYLSAAFLQTHAPGDLPQKPQRVMSSFAPQSGH